MTNLRVMSLGGVFAAMVSIAAVPAHAESNRSSDASRPVPAALAIKAAVSEEDSTARAGQHRANRAAVYAKLIAQHAKANGVPVSLAHAVVRIESNYNPRARGSAGEIGLMQIKPATARAIGFSGSAKELYDPSTNLYWGMKYLAGAYQLAGGDTCGTILRYNGGHYAKRMNPVSARYCRQVASILRSDGDKLAAL